VVAWRSSLLLLLGGIGARWRRLAVVVVARAVALGLSGKKLLL
jgi:hypothetical protein